MGHLSGSDGIESEETVEADEEVLRKRFEDACNISIIPDSAFGCLIRAKAFRSIYSNENLVGISMNESRSPFYTRNRTRLHRTKCCQVPGISAGERLMSGTCRRIPQAAQWVLAWGRKLEDIRGGLRQDKSRTCWHHPQARLLSLPPQPHYSFPQRLPVYITSSSPSLLRLV